MENSGAEGLRVVVLDDEPQTRRWLTDLLTDSGAEVVGQAASAEYFRASVWPQHFDVAVVDIRLDRNPDDVTGLRVALGIRQARPWVGIVVLSTYDHVAYALRLLDTNPRGVAYLVKTRLNDLNEVVEAVKKVHRGLNAFDEQVQTAMLDFRARKPEVEALTSAELETLKLMAQAFTNRAIAKRLSLAEPTVEARIGEIFRKLGVRDADGQASVNSRVAAVVRYLRNLERFQAIADIEPLHL